ncbi:hypothetical protein CDL60_03230 [Roseateles noduli]|nr:hypothetical protein CDL60_03230 [Roseateles noduli]
MRFHPPSLLSTLAACALVAACGGRSPDADAAPSSTLIPVPDPTVACSVLRVTPDDAIKQTFVDPLMTIVYTAPTAGGCGDLTLQDDGQSPVTANVVASNEWPNPQGGFVGTRTIEAASALKPGAIYGLRWNGKTVSTFKTGSERRGAIVSVTDQALQLPSLPNAAHLGQGDINGVLDAFADAIAKGNDVKKFLFETALRLELPNIARPDARYGAAISKVTYRSADARGNPVTLSALMIAPEQSPGGRAVDFNGMPVIIGQRGATDSGSDAPSSGATPMGVPGLIAAGKGHLFLAPDLIGLGDSKALPQAYLVAPDAAGQTQDLLRAARTYVQQRYQSALSTDLRLFGGSQGAFSTIASLPYLAREGTVRVVSAADGPYDVYRTFHGALLTAAGAARDAYASNENLDFLPSHTRDVMTSFQAYGNYAFDPKIVFDADGKFLPSFLADYKDGKVKDFVRQLGANSLVTGSQVYDLPQAQVRLYHFSTDTLVPAQNTVDMLVALGDKKHRFAGVQRGSCHENSEVVKLILKFSKSSKATHTLCVAFQMDDFVGGL